MFIFLLNHTLFHRTSWYFQTWHEAIGIFWTCQISIIWKKYKENYIFSNFWKEKWLKRHIWREKWNEFTARVQTHAKKSKLKWYLKSFFFSNKNRNNIFFLLQVHPYYKVCWKKRHFSLTMNMNSYKFNFCIIWTTCLVCFKTNILIFGKAIKWIASK